MYSPFIKNHIYTDLLPPPPPPSKCPTLSDPMDCSPPGSYVHGIFQARVLEWGAIAFPAFSKTSLNIRTFTVHILLKPGLENFEYCFTSM